MTTLGLCTHFTETDRWAFEFAFDLVQKRGWQLNICHWLHSPYRLRRDLVQDNLLAGGKTAPVSPQLLTRLERELREYYEPHLGDFTDVAFKLCEGFYRVELPRCFRKNLLDLVVMGHQTEKLEPAEDDLSLDTFTAKLNYPLILVGHAGPRSFLLNRAALVWLEKLELPEGSWELLEPSVVSF